MSLAADMAVYLNQHYANQLKELTQGPPPMQYTGGVSLFGHSQPPKLDMYAAFNFANGFLSTQKSGAITLVIDGVNNRFEAR